MGYPGDHGHSGGRRPAGSAPQDEAPFGGANPYSFPPLSSGDTTDDPPFNGNGAFPDPAPEPAAGGFGQPGPNGQPNPFGEPPGDGEGPFGGFGGGYGDDPYAQQAQMPLGAPVGPGAPEERPNPRGLYGPPPGDPDGQPTSMFGAEGGMNQRGMYGPPGGEQTRSYGQPGEENPYGQFGQPGALSGVGQDGDERGGGKKLLAIGAVGAAVVLIGGGIYLATSMGGGSGKKTAAQASTPAASAPSPTSASASPSPAATGALEAKLKSQATDPQPLTIAEVFKNAQFKGYKMTGNDITTKCGSRVHGANLVKALKTGGCTQVLRATYITADGKLMGTIGVANLSTTAAAKKAQKAANSTGSWLVPLAGSGATKKISGKAASLGGAEVRGHYLILSWVQRPDGKVIGAGQKAAAAAFTTQVPLGSNLYGALQYRGISGKPYGA